MKKGNTIYYTKLKVKHKNGNNPIRIFRITREAESEQEAADLAIEYISDWENIAKVEVLKVTQNFFCIEKYKITFEIHSTNGQVKTFIRDVFAEDEEEAWKVLNETIARWQNIRKVEPIKIEPFYLNEELKSSKPQLKDIAIFK